MYIVNIHGEYWTGTNWVKNRSVAINYNKSNLPLTIDYINSYNNKIIKLTLNSICGEYLDNENSLESGLVCVCD